MHLLLVCTLAGCGGERSLSQLEADLAEVGVACATGIYDAASVADAARFFTDVVAKFGRIDSWT